MSNKKQDWYYWRLFATGLSFFNFGLGGLVLRFIFVPILLLIPMEQSARHRIGRHWIHLAYKLFILQMKTFGVLSYETHGLEKLKPGQLVIANHPTLIDVAFLLSFIDNANCIVRHGLFVNPFTSGPIKGAGYIPNIEPEQLVHDCMVSLQAGDTLIVFPEGTRTVPGQTPKFQRGAANIALASKADVIPVDIRCSENTLTKGEKWYHIPNRRPHWTFTVGEVMTLPELDSSPKAARQITRIFFEYFFPEENTQCP